MNNLLKYSALLFLVYSNPSFSFTSKQIDNPLIDGTLYYTAEQTEQQVLVMLGGSEGGSFVEREYFVQAKVKELVAKGYAVLALTYFDYRSDSEFIPNDLAKIPLEYFSNTFEWINQQQELKKNSFAIYGLSRGGELALILSSMFTEVDAVIAGVPSAFVGGAYSNLWDEAEWTRRIESDPCESAWTWQGKNIQSICNRDVMGMSPWDVIYDEELVKGTHIELEKSQAPILLLSGVNDKIWPSSYMSDLMIERLANADYPYYYDHKRYETGHFLFTPSWPDVVVFLEEHFPVDR